MDTRILLCCLFYLQDKFRRMLEINEALGGGIDLASPAQELVKEGKIVKISPRNGAQHDRYIFLVPTSCTLPSVFVQ